MENEKKSYQALEDEVKRLKKEIDVLKLSDNSDKISDSKYRKMIGNIGDVIVIIDSNGLNKYKSPNVEKYFGWKPDELIGRDTFENVHPEDLEFVKNFINKLLNEPNVVDTAELRYKCKNRAYKWIEFTCCNLLLDPDINGLLGNYHDITERKQAVQALKENEANLHSLINNRDESIWSIDRDYNYINFNNFFKKAYFDTFNIELKQGLNSLDILTPDLKSFWKPKYDKTLTGEKVVFEFNNIVGNEIHFYEVSLNPIISDGKITGVSGLSIDITDRKKIEQSLLESENLYRSLYQNLISISSLYEVVFSEDGEPCDYRFLSVNSLYEKSIGLNATELKGRTLLEVFPGTEDIWLQTLKKVCLTGISATVQDYSKEVDRYFEITAFVPQKGQLALIGNDITDRKKAEITLKENQKQLKAQNEEYLTINEELQERNNEYAELNEALTKAKDIAEESEERLKALQNASFGGITIHDKGIILDCNNGLSEITGYSYNELIGMNGLLLIAEQSRDLVKSKIESGYEKAYEAIGLRKNGEEYPIRLEARTIPFKGKKVRSVEFRDITEIKAAQIEIIKAKEKAEESNRLKTEFLHNMSHEVRTPMNGIIGFSGMIGQPDISDEERNYYSKIIQNSSYQLLRIIDDILEISSIETSQHKIEENTFCLNDLLMQLLSIYDLKSKERNIPIYLKKGLDDSQSIITSDKAKLNRIIGNLIENALKFTSQGYIEVGYYIEGDKLIIYVKDTGIGIDSKNFDLIFERFSQEEKDISKIHGGLGLGLSISKESAHLLGGDITIESEKGKGSTFYITIPHKTIVKKKSTSANSFNHQIKDRKEIVVLIAEDEDVNYLYLEAVFKGASHSKFNIIHAKNGQEAVDICLENKNVDIILMDIKMPLMNGLEATKIIKKKTPTVPIIAQTAYSTEQDKQTALNWGCDDFISKPIDKFQLFKMINQHYKSV